MKKLVLILSFLFLFASFGIAQQPGGELDGVRVEVTKKNANPIGEWKPLKDLKQSEERFFQADAEAGIKFIEKKTQIINELHVQVKRSYKGKYTTYAIFTLLANEPSHKGKYTGRYTIDKNVAGNGTFDPQEEDWSALAADIMVKIISPWDQKDISERTEDELQDNLDKWFNTDKQFPYCYSYQGVASEKGEKEINLKKKRIKKILGETFPDKLKNYRWSISEDVGTLNKLTEIREPIHTPPEEAKIAGTSGDLVLQFEGHPEVKDVKTLVIFKDHLARDVINFVDGNNCMRNEEGTNGIELTDGNFVPGIQLGCSNALGHAHDGIKISAYKVWKRLRDQEGWYENNTLKKDLGKKIIGKLFKTEGYTWPEFLTKKLERGDKVFLGDVVRPDRHPVTVISEGQDINGKNALTYSGDTVEGKFRHEKVEDYYTKVLDNIGLKDRRIWILRQKLEENNE